MRRYQVRFTEGARDDIVRLYDFLLERDLEAAERALEAIETSLSILETTPFSCRKALSYDPFLRELVIPFGESGYVALFRIERRRVTVLAVRHQHERDFL